MKLEEALADVHRLFIDSAPLIYYIERHPRYFATVSPIFDRIDGGDFEAVTSTICLAECLVLPFKDNNPELAAQFRDRIVHGVNTRHIGVDAAVEEAARLRAAYRLSLADALQLAAALNAGCDAFLTNDADFLTVPGLRVLLIDQLETL